MGRTWDALTTAEHRGEAEWSHSEMSPGPPGTAVLRKTGDNNCWGGCGEKAASTHSRWERKLLQPPWKIAWRLLKASEVQLPYDPGVLFLGIDPQEIKSIAQRAVCTLTLSAALFTIDKI